MLRLLLILAGFSMTWAAIPSGYYDTADGKSGTTLQQALHDIIDNHTVVSYTSLWTHFQTTDDKANGKVWDMYSDVPGGTLPYEYTFVDDQCGSYADEGDCYNREHSWPKSWFDDASPMNTDLFHLVPTDGKVNGMRSNYPYGEVTSPTWTSENGGKRGSNTSSGYSGTVFEPIDDYKGDLARNYFYMSTRYYGEDSGWTGSDMTNGAQLESWALEMMLTWHGDDAVSQKELDRNEAVYGIQDNRNPFIDHPEYAARIWGSVPSAPTDLASSNVAETSVTLTWTDNASDETGYYVYQDDNPIDTLAASSSTTGINGLSAGTTYDFEVSCYNDAGESATTSLNVTTSGSSGSSEIELYISEVSEGSATSTEFLELYNAGSAAVDISGYKIIRVTASNNTSDYVFDIGSDGTAGDVSIPAKGLWVLSRGADRSTFESGFSSFPASAKFYQGSTDLYYASGTARRWRLRADDGTVNTDDGTLVDDTQAAAGGSGQRTVQSPTGTFATSASSNGANSSPGELDGDQSLPVELSSWTATSANGRVILNWITESEIENQGFILSRSQNSESGSQELALFSTHDALLGHGSTTARNTYSYTDKDVIVGQTYTYQLSDVDYRGDVTKHSEISVTVRAAEQELKPTELTLHAAYPNPFNPELTVSFTVMGETLHATSLQVFDVNGRFVETLYDGSTDAGMYTVKWNGDKHPSGIYFIRLSSGNDVQIQGVTLLR